MHLKALRYSRTHYFFLLSDFALLRQNAWDTRQMWESLELFEKKQQVWGHWWKDGQDEDAYLRRQALVSAYRSSTPLLCSLPSLIVWTSIFSWNFSTAELHLGPPAQVCRISFHHPVEGNKISQEIFGSWRLQHSPVSVSFDKTSHFLSNNFLNPLMQTEWGLDHGKWELSAALQMCPPAPRTHISRGNTLPDRADGQAALPTRISGVTCNYSPVCKRTQAFDLLCCSQLPASQILPAFPAAVP